VPSFDTNANLVLGVDGGGSHVLCVLAEASTGRELGRGEAGPANLQAVGVENALREIDLSVQRAFEAARLPRSRVAAACLGLAGVDWSNGLDVIQAWSDRAGLTAKISVANDATLLLAAGTAEGWGLAVVCGTGSIAFVRTPDGTEGRAGGWGYLLGDEGSAFQVTLSALRLAARSADGCIGPTVLVDLFMKRMGAATPAAIIDAVYRGEWDRAALAALAPLVLEAAENGDTLACQVVEKQASELALTAVTPVLKHKLPCENLPVALTGGLLLRSASYRRRFLEAMKQRGVTPGQVQLVEQPALGAVAIARRSLSGN